MFLQWELVVNDIPNIDFSVHDICCNQTESFINHMKIVISMLLGSLWLTSCSPVYYAPNTHIVPLMESKGDLALQVFRDHDNKQDFQVLYAVTNNIGVMLNHMNVNNSYSDYSQGNDFVASSIERNSG